MEEDPPGSGHTEVVTSKWSHRSGHGRGPLLLDGPAGVPPPEVVTWKLVTQKRTPGSGHTEVVTQKWSRKRTPPPRLAGVPPSGPAGVPPSPLWTSWGTPPRWTSWASGWYALEKRLPRIDISSFLQIVVHVFPMQSLLILTVCGYNIAQAKLGG